MLDSISSVVTAIAAFAAVLALIWITARVARFSGFAQRPASGRLLAVEDVIALDTRRRLHLIRCEQRRVLLLTGGGQDVVVGWIDREGPAE